MYAIVEIGGQQHKVQKDQKIYVNKLDAAEGTSLEFDKVMLVDKDGNVSVGLPYVDGTRVAAQVVAHVKDDKVYIFKHKRRKGYRRFNGHRQPLTELHVYGILGKGEAFKEAAAPKKAKKAEPKAQIEATEAEATPKKKAVKKAAPKAERKESKKAPAKKAKKSKE